MTGQADRVAGAAARGTATTSNAADMPPLLAQPEEIVADPVLSLEEKRSILASWLSDAHAIPDAPRWRLLENGALVDSHDLWKGLRLLDEQEGYAPRGADRDSPSRAGRRNGRKRLLGAFVRRRRNDDDDDPPPSPVAARLPVLPTSGGDAGASVELAFAA